MNQPIDLRRYRARLDEALCPTPCPDALADLFNELTVAYMVAWAELELWRLSHPGRLSLAARLAREGSLN